MKVMPFVVAYQSPAWIKVAVGSYRDVFGDAWLTVIDNNQDQSCEESEWLRGQRFVRRAVNDGESRTHGSGMDLALRLARKEGYDAILHFEPDCLISDDRWLITGRKPG